MNGLTDFQKTILHVLAEESLYGLAIKEVLEDYYDEEVNHGRLYPNLDALVEEGYVEKQAMDDRTNQYHLTREGERAVREELAWELERYVGGGEAESRLASLVEETEIRGLPEV